MSYGQKPSIGSNNGLVPITRQTIMWTSADPIHWRIYAALVDTLKPILSQSDITCNTYVNIWIIVRCASYLDHLIIITPYAVYTAM